MTAMIRVGQGFDAHRFQQGGRLILGGVEIPHTHGLEAHSDGDVVLHALTDALLGAAALGDLGRHFPDTDDAYSGADSRILLRHAVRLAGKAGWRVVNADVTVIAQRPKLAMYMPYMRQNMAADLDCDTDAINVKATTTEGMGFTGSGEGMAAMAVILLERPR